MSLPSPMRRGWRAAVLTVTLALAGSAGCATRQPAAADALRRSLRPLPDVTAHPGADQAIIAAFFSANGIRLAPGELDEILPVAARPRRMDRQALRRIAWDHHRVLIAVRADERFLWDALGAQRPLLLLLPDADSRRAGASLHIPVAWDRSSQTIALLNGDGNVQPVPAAEFFARRERLHQAALCLLRPGGVRRLETTREHRLHLADFWFHRGFYRHARAAYAGVLEDSGGTDAEALIGLGNILVRRGRYARAIPVFRAALALEPGHPRILNNLAYAMLQDGRELDTARLHILQALEAAPHNPLILETAGSLHLRLGDAPHAARLLESAWAHSRRQPAHVQIAIMDQLARAWLASGRPDLARQVSDHRRRSFPEDRLPRDLLRLYSP